MFLLLFIGLPIYLSTESGELFITRQSIVGTWVAKSDSGRVTNILVFHRNGDLMITDIMEQGQMTVKYELVTPRSLRMIGPDGDSMFIPILIDNNNLIITARGMRVVYTKSQ
ncbi:hypothetical protein CJ255_11790 [Candidatus Viridilinea mediisalina]|uniref:DUF5640 domain-containing protein n=1 Tax=Candidatus Viridilinea mediisalina TaxID=2024553 RepID=A0A2A6RIW5_9CHLR|nr:hypothetical protein CJ255_11790 [Candidatus Viridilinea mediisalina]